MSHIEKNIRELKRLQDIQQLPGWMNSLHPLGKLLVCVIYIITVASVNKYDIVHLILMAVFPVFAFIVGELSIKDGLYRMRMILPLVAFVGIFNPLLDRTILFTIGNMGISGGVVSMFTLIIKGLFTVLSAYILIATTSIDDICYALRCIHVPKILCIVIMLIYRYFDVMAGEADRVTTAYMLRAPRQKGIHYKAWGALVGQWLLRSMDRAEVVYESMMLRGFDGDFKVKKKEICPADVIYPIAWCIVFAVIKFVL
ncbi:MAG: cobalt ECF transporter T component CbiQ [Lachnospiraceae bacterium]|nr:cobalt ECF transporter T component CbiQ [Lachnospiraceae bacterium]